MHKYMYWQKKIDKTTAAEKGKDIALICNSKKAERERKNRRLVQNFR